MLKKLKDIGELIAFSHSIFALPFILIAMLKASNGWFGFQLMTLAILSAITARNFAMGFNRLVDVDIDRDNPRTKNRPSVDGRIDTKTIKLFVSLNAIIFIIIANYINNLAFYLSFFVLFILASYSYMKRFSYMAHIVLGVSLGFAPIAGAIAVLEYIPLWSVLLGLGVVFWVAGFDILYSLQDMEFDKKRGLFSIPSKFGQSFSLSIAKVFHIFAVVLWFLFVYQTNSTIFGYLAIIISGLLLIYEHYLISFDMVKIDRAFFTVNGYLGIIFLILIVVDIVWK